MSYDADLGVVERVTVEVGRQVMREVDGGVRGFSPFIRCHRFADSSIQSPSSCAARTTSPWYLSKHEFIRRLRRRYCEERIAIPYPIRTMHLRTSEASHPER